MGKREKEVYSYMVGLSRLYGIMQWRQFIKVFNRYNLPKITKAEIMDTPYYWNRRRGSCRLYSNALAYATYMDQLDDSAWYHAGGDHYMPTEEEIRAMSSPSDYMQKGEAHEALYAEFRRILDANPPKFGNVDDAHKELCVVLNYMISSGANQQDIFDMLSDYGINFGDLPDAQRVLDLLTNAWNNTRMWANHGFTPLEIRAKMPQMEAAEPKLVPSRTTKHGDRNNEFASRFYKLWYKLIYWINQTHKLEPPFPIPIYGQKVDEQPFVKIREKLWSRPQYIVEFLASSASVDLNQSERKTVEEWGKKFIKAKFIIHKHTDEYSIFQQLAADKGGNRLYKVCGITNPISAVLDRHPLPLLVEAVLLPFDGKIVYDTFLAPLAVRFSANIKRELTTLYNNAGGESAACAALV